jgi:hypothetical protein
MLKKDRTTKTVDFERQMTPLVQQIRCAHHLPERQ